ncbi:MAG: hypothetical protein DME99_13415, partial [Verrucomicrobia bacterium]
LFDDWDERVIRKLRAKAATNGVSAEEQARRILRRSLVGEIPAMSLICFTRSLSAEGGAGFLLRRRKK